MEEKELRQKIVDIINEYHKIDVMFTWGLLYRQGFIMSKQEEMDFLLLHEKITEEFRWCCKKYAVINIWQSD